MGKMNQDVTEGGTKTAQDIRMKLPKKRCTMHQMINLIKYMSRHPKLAKNQFVMSKAGLKKKEEEWTNLAAHLNEMGSEKTVAQWQNTWRDLVRQTRLKDIATKNKARAAEDVPDSMKSSDEDDGEINNITVWKKKILDIMKPSDEESVEEEIQTVLKQPSESISVPANPTPEKVEEPKSPSSHLNSPEPPEFESDSSWTSPTPSDTGPFQSQLNSPEPPEFESDSSWTSPTSSDTGPVQRRTRSTVAQIETLVDCMTLNPSMGCGPQKPKIADWQRLTELLNTMGPSKQVVGWQKTWYDHVKWQARTAATKKRTMKDGVPLMKQNITEIIAAYKDQSSSLDESRVEFAEFPSPTEGMPVPIARSPPSRLNSPDLDNIGDLDNSINFQDIELNPEMSTLSLDEDTSRLGKESPSRDSGEMSPLRYDSDQNSDGESNGRHFDEVTNEQSSCTQVFKQINPSATSGYTAAKDTNQASSMPFKNDRDSDGSVLPKTRRKIVSHACSRVQRAALVDYMSTHSALATSNYKGVDTLDPRYAEWRHLTKYLNKMGPAKTTGFWKRTWEELIVRSQRAEQNSGSKEISQKVLNIISATPTSQDNSAKTDTGHAPLINAGMRVSAGKKSPERRNSGQMSPERRNSGQMSPELRNSGQMSPERRHSDQMSPERRNYDQMSPERRNSDQMSPERRNSGQMSPERRNSGQMSPVQPNSGQRPIKRLVIPVRCYAGQVSSQGSEQMSPMLNSKDLLEIVEGRASPTESDVELEIATLKGPRRKRPTKAQTAFLVDYLKDNVGFAMSMRYTPAGCEKWRRLSKNLNKIGPSKSVQSWRNTWNNLKRNALLKKDNPLALLPYSTVAILEIIEAHKNPATTTAKTASMNGENGQTDNSQQFRKTSELVENSRCSKAQIAALADYMTANPVLATSEYKGPCADDSTIAGWRQLSKYLNRMGVARSTTGWKQIWRSIVTCVRNFQQPNDWDEKISRKVLKAVGDETFVKNHSKLKIDIVEESGQMSPVRNFNQMSPQYSIGRECTVNFDQMSPMHSTGHVSPVDFDQMPSLYNSGQVTPVDFDQMSHMHNTGQMPLQSFDNTGQVSVNFGQMSPVHNNSQPPVNNGQMSPVQFGQMSYGHNNCQVNSGQAGDFETSAVEMACDVEVNPPLYSKHKRKKTIRSSRAQVKALVNYMYNHPALAKGEEKAPIAVEKRQLEWRRLGKHLNRMGPTKSTAAWKDTWRNLKRSARMVKNSRGFQAIIYQQILNIMSPAKCPIESSIDTVEETDTLPKPHPIENISIPIARSPSPELCLNAPDRRQCDIEHSNYISKHKNSEEHSQQISFVSRDFCQFKPDVSARHQDSEKLSQQKSSLGQSNNMSARLRDSGEHSQQISSFSEFLSILRDSVHSHHVSIKEEDSQSRHSLQISPVQRTSGESNNVSTRFKESEKNCLQMSSAQRSSGQSNNNQLFRHTERTNDWDGSGRERRLERGTLTRKQLNSLVDCVYAHPVLASEQETSNPRHHEWRIIGKLLNKMGPIYCTDWKNRWKELKHDVAKRWEKDGTYTGCIDSIRVKKVLELIAKYPTSDLTDSDIEIVEDMPTQVPTTHHPKYSLQHNVVETLSRNHTVNHDSINAESVKRIATSNVENRTSVRGSIERIKEDEDKASSATATSNISSEDTNNLLKELIGELRRSNELKVEQNGILKQLVKEFSTDALKSNRSNKRKLQTEHVEPPVVLKREVEDLTEEYSTNTKNSERSGEHYAHTSIQDGPSHKDEAHVTSVRNGAKSSERPQIPISSIEEASSSPKKKIRIADITSLMKPTGCKRLEPSVKWVVKPKTITKPPKMQKVNLLRLKDGSMVVMPGTKLPASNDEYQTFVVGSVKHVDNEKLPETAPAGFEDYEF